MKRILFTAIAFTLSYTAKRRITVDYDIAEADTLTRQLMEFIYYGQKQYKIPRFAYFSHKLE